VGRVRRQQQSQHRRALHPSDQHLEGDRDGGIASRHDAVANRATLAAPHTGASVVVALHERATYDSGGQAAIMGLTAGMACANRSRCRGWCWPRC